MSGDPMLERLVACASSRRNLLRWLRIGGAALAARAGPLIQRKQTTGVWRITATRSVLAAFVAGLLAVAAGCGGGGSDEAVPATSEATTPTQAASETAPDEGKRSGGRFVYPLEGLDEEHGSDIPVSGFVFPAAYRAFTDNLLFNSLVELDPTAGFEPKPELAESWTVSDDGLVYTFKLRQDVTWHDGEPFDAEDVKFTLDAVLDPKNAAATAADLSIVEEVIVVDPSTVEIRLREPSAAFIKNVAIVIHPEHLLGPELAAGTPVRETEYAKHPVGTGPFVWKEYKRGDSLTVEANMDYFAGPPNLDEIVVVASANPGGAVARLRAGEVDAAAVPGTQLALVEGDERYVIDVKPSSLLNSVALNTHDPLFADPAVRIALSQFADRQALIDALEGGAGTALTSPLQNTSWETDAGASLVSDPEAGARTLEAAGWQRNADGIWEKDGRTLSFTLVDGFAPQMAELVASAWRDQGVDVELKIGDYNEIIDPLFADPLAFQASTWGFGSPIDPDAVLTSSYHSNGAFNIFEYENEAVDEALDRGRYSLDESERRAAYREFEEAIAADPPYVFLYSSPINFVVSKDIAGWDKGILEYVGESWVFYNIEDWYRVD